MTKLIRKTQQPSDYPSNQIHDAYSTSTTDTYSCNYINENVGDLTQLNTTNKDNLVGAINEVNSNCSINNQNINATEDIIEITPLGGDNYNEYGNTYYYKVGSIVYLHIGLSRLVPGSENVIFTLPAGYRPRGYALGHGISDNSSSTAVAQISGDGTITIIPDSRLALIDMSFVSFN